MMHDVDGFGGLGLVNAPKGYPDFLILLYADSCLSAGLFAFSNFGGPENHEGFGLRTKLRCF